MNKTLKRAVSGVTATVVAAGVIVTLSTQVASAHGSCTHKTQKLSTIKVLKVIPFVERRKVYTGTVAQGNFNVHYYVEQRRMTPGQSKGRTGTRPYPWSSAPLPLGAGHVSTCAVKVRR